MDRHGIQQRIQRLGLQANIAVNPHALRRAFVTINANQGKPLVMLQMACGHNDIATTRSYCMTTEDEVVLAMADWSWTYSKALTVNVCNSTFYGYGMG
jgi:site-specific recombinase XerD